MKTLSDKSPDLDLSIYEELPRHDARWYIEGKYGISTRILVEKALDKFDADMRQSEPWQNFWTFYHKN
jgi:hypothetical protein